LEILEKYKTLGAFKKSYARHIGISEREEREDEYIDNPCLDEEEVQEILVEFKMTNRWLLPLRTRRNFDFVDCA